MKRLTYTLKEVAQLLGLSYATVYRLVQKGEIKTIRKTHAHLVPATELERWVDESVI